MFDFLRKLWRLEPKRRPTIAVVGASGAIGKRVVRRALDRGFEVRGQTRDAARLAEFADHIRIDAFEPSDVDALYSFVRGADVVVYALGLDIIAPTTFFSRSTEALIAAMSKAGVRRLIAVTGVGAGETRGHGGFFYDRVVFPLFARYRYKDKDRQEALIAASGLDWTIVRPAVFSESRRKGPLQVVTEIGPSTVLRRVSRDEVADFIMSEIGSRACLRQRPFIGHP